MVTIIELKKGKIIQTKICQECFSKRVEETQLLGGLPDDPAALLDLFLKDKSYDEDCAECAMLNLDEGEVSKDQKIKALESKMAAAVRVEDYEAAALIKKEIEKIKDQK